MPDDRNPQPLDRTTGATPSLTVTDDLQLLRGVLVHDIRRDAVSYTHLTLPTILRV